MHGVEPIHAQVLKRFNGSRPYEPGEIVDPSNWPPNRLKQMLRFRYVQLVTPTSAVKRQAPAADTSAPNPPRRRRGRPRKIEVQA